MSKKDYIAIAESIRDTRDQDWRSVDLFVSSLVSKLCSLFANDNDRFNNQRFRDACYSQEDN